MGDCDYLVTAADSCGAQGQFDSISPIGNAYSVAHPMISGKLRLEGFDFRAENIPAAVRYALDCCLKFACE